MSEENIKVGIDFQKIELKEAMEAGRRLREYVRAKEMTDEKPNLSLVVEEGERLKGQLGEQLWEADGRYIYVNGEGLEVGKFHCYSEADTERSKAMAALAVHLHNNAEALFLAAKEAEGLRSALESLLLLVEHETELPESAANGITDESGLVDEGVCRASEIVMTAKDVLNGRA